MMIHRNLKQLVHSQEHGLVAAYEMVETISNTSIQLKKPEFPATIPASNRHRLHYLTFDE